MDSRPIIWPTGSVRSSMRSFAGDVHCPANGISQVRSTGHGFVVETRGTTPLSPNEQLSHLVSGNGVIGIDPAAHAVELDATAFYPTGGGQPHDTVNSAPTSGRHP